MLPYRIFWLLIAAITISLTAYAQPSRATFYVADGQIIAPNGEKVVLRGVNKMIFYQDRSGAKSYSEIAKTGANCVRIFWFTTGTAAELDKTLANCIAHRLIPIPSVWEATGKWQNLSQCVDYWRRPDIAAVIKKYEKYVLLNIANEAGDHTIPETEFQNNYQSAIAQLRKAGIRVPLVIDAAGWGRQESYVLNTGNALLAADPQRNLIFSWHPWDANAPVKRIAAAIDTAIARRLPFVVGEFAEKSIGCACCIPWRFIVEYCQKKSIGWLSWEWGPGNADCAEMNMSADGTYETLRGWGKEAAVTSPYSIQKTSVRPAIFDTTGDAATSH